MNALVIYDSQYGNTERIAMAIADAMRAYGQAQVAHVSAAPVDLAGVDTLVIGCPTQGWRPTPVTQSFIQTLIADRTRGIAVACFDTRFKKPRWLTGSAAGAMARKLDEAGVSLAMPPESFFVVGKEGPLVKGEVERAASWGSVLVSGLTQNMRRSPVAQR